MNPHPLDIPPPALPRGGGTRVVRFDAGCLADGSGLECCPGSLLVELTTDRGTNAGVTWPVSGRTEILAAGLPGTVDSHPAAAGSARVECPGCVLIPGLVNAHTHLDLTLVGPKPYDAERGFRAWLEMIRNQRPQDDAAIAESVRAGIELVRRGGTVAVGDIAGATRAGPTLTPYRTLRESTLCGVSFLEFFAIGSRLEASLARVAQALSDLDADEMRRRDSAGDRVRFGLQPHAPNTVSLAGYRFAMSTGRPISTHLAESLAEREFTASARGPFRSLLEDLGLWSGTIGVEVGHGRSPVRHLASTIRARPILAVHVNDASDDDLGALAEGGHTVVYCPRASEYFGRTAELGPHRYREMRRRGIPVALGTDSIVNLPPRCAAPGGPGISVLDEMRALFRRDGVSVHELLELGTRGGAVALGLDPAAFLFTGGARAAGVVAVPVDGRPTLRGALAGESGAVLLMCDDGSSADRRAG